MDLYESQYNRSGGDGYVARGKALVTTGLKVTSEGLEWLSDYLVPEPQQHAGQNGTHAAGDKSYADAAKE